MESLQDSLRGFGGFQIGEFRFQKNLYGDRPAFAELRRGKQDGCPTGFAALR